jgi:hypothetical protein
VLVRERVDQSAHLHPAVFVEPARRHLHLERLSHAGHPAHHKPGAEVIGRAAHHPERILLQDRQRGAAIDEVSEYLESVLDVRHNGHDIEVDYRPFGYETHVLRIDGIIPFPGLKLGWKRALPIRRQSLIEVEDLTHRLIAHAKEDPSLLKCVQWRTFERIIAELLEAAGWHVLELTRGSKDGGVDIYAAFPTSNGSALAVIDCKRYEDKIGVEKVRAIAGLKLQHQANVGMLVTTSYFTSGALALERNELRDHVQLHDFDQVKQWLAMHEWQCVSGLYLPKSRFSADADE